MAHTSSTRTSTGSSRRVAVGLAAIAGLAMVLGTGTLAASAAPLGETTAATASATTCTFGQHLVSAWLHVPKALRADLKKLKAMDAGPDRRAEAKSIKAKALAGGYGSAAETKAKWLADHKGEGVRPLPDNLKADLKTLRAAPKADKVKQADAIADKALAGGYGDKVESFAKAVQASDAWKDCTPAKAPAAS
ncbi:MAG: hypothetical protein JWO10_1119 [Microbacteriaceae bacterium]|nr:hypothetical protein [Microbacteriaceae bacterium]